MNTSRGRLFFTYSKVGQTSCKAFIFREALRDYGEIQAPCKTREIECRQPLGRDPRSDDCSKPLCVRYRAHLLMQSSHDQDGPLGNYALCHTKVIACPTLERCIKGLFNKNICHSKECVCCFWAHFKTSQILFKNMCIKIFF